MVDVIYIEKQALSYERTQRIVKRYPKAEQIIIDRYSEVFNPSNQNFRTQKNNPALILAVKDNKKVLATPSQYETGGGANYYFSHMLNCIYDCRYCFLQGMYRSANYLVFVNYDDFIEQIKEVADEHKNDEKPVWFFSGYDCDSLAYEPITGFADTFIPAFKNIPNAVLELRTKSTQIRSLLKRPAQDNVVIAYSLSPEEVASSIEIGAPSLAKRVEALAQLQTNGWRIGLRFDPIIWHQDYQTHYKQMIDFVFSELDTQKIDSVTLGGFRLPKGFYKIMNKLHPEHWLFNAGLSERDGMVTYRHEIEKEMLGFVSKNTLQHIDETKLFVYETDDLNG